MTAQRDLFGAAEIEADADFSADRIYRYTLHRIWDRSKPIAFICGMNPSVAAEGEESDDMTIKKETGFAKQWGCGGFWKGNLAAYVATNPDELGRVSDPIGPENDARIEAALAQCKMAVVAWGATDFPDRAIRIMRVLELIRRSGLKAWCLGYTSDGSPRHPSRIAYATTLEDFVVRT